MMGGSKSLRATKQTYTKELKPTISILASPHALFSTLTHFSLSLKKEFEIVFSAFRGSIRKVILVFQKLVSSGGSFTNL